MEFLYRQCHVCSVDGSLIIVAVATDHPPEDAMKNDWLPEAVLALAFVVALVAQSAQAFH